MTKIVVVELAGTTIEQLLGGERLANFRGVAQSGCYGPLAGIDATTVAAWTSFTANFAANFAAQGVDFRLISLDAPADSGGEPGEIDDQFVHLDHALGTLLETLSDDSILLIVSTAGDVGPGAFILNAATLPLNGEAMDAQLLDLPPTLLELARIETANLTTPLPLQGCSLVARLAMGEPSADELSAEARRLIADRLSGLGYI